MFFLSFAGNLQLFKDVNFRKREFFYSPILSIYFGFFSAAQNVIYADIIELRQAQEGFRGRDPFAVLKFGQQGLLDPCSHLHRNLGISPTLS